MHFNRYLQYWARIRADRPLVIFEGATLSWGEFDEKAEALAAHLQSIGVRPGDRFGCLLGNSHEWVIAFGAAIKAGAIMVPLNTLFGAFELKEIAANADCAAIVSTPGHIVKINAGLAAPDDSEILVYDIARDWAATPLSDIFAKGGRAEAHSLNDEAILTLSYTSGTTGVPKGAMLSNRAVLAAIMGQMLTYGWTSEERFLILAPLAFTGGIISNLAPVMMLGACGILERTVDPLRVLALLEEYRVTFFGGVPALFQRVAEAPEFKTANISTLRNGCTGGAAVLMLDVYAEKGIMIRQQYGLTEACGGVSCPTAEASLARPDACGTPFPGVDVELRGDDGKPVAQGEIGEIHVRGAQLLSGYWRRPEQTAAAFDGDWLKTGDLARLNDHGEIVIVDRKKNMIKSGGVNIYPAEVERALMSIPGIAEVLAFGLPSEAWGEELVAAIHAPGLTDGAALMRQARELLGAYKTPKQIRFSPTPLPRTTTNKIARQKLDELWRALDPKQTVAA